MPSRKLTVPLPTRNELRDASKEMRRGHPAGGRVEAEEHIAVRKGLRKPARRKPARRGFRINATRPTLGKRRAPSRSNGKRTTARKRY